MSPRRPGTITICSSSRFYATARRLADELVGDGAVVFTPRFDYDEEKVEVTAEDKEHLTREFLEKIRSSDAIYVVNEGGYTGRSVCIEVGYAAALGKTVFLAEQPTEAAIAALADQIVPVDRFPALLRDSV